LTDAAARVLCKFAPCHAVRLAMSVLTAVQLGLDTRQSICLSHQHRHSLSVSSCHARTHAERAVQASTNHASLVGAVRVLSGRELHAQQRAGVCVQQASSCQLLNGGSLDVSTGQKTEPNQRFLP